MRILNYFLDALSRAWARVRSQNVHPHIPPSNTNAEGSSHVFRITTRSSGLSSNSPSDKLAVFLRRAGAWLMSYNLDRQEITYRFPGPVDNKTLIAELAASLNRVGGRVVSSNSQRQEITFQLPGPVHNRILDIEFSHPENSRAFNPTWHASRTSLTFVRDENSPGGKIY